MTQLAGYNRSVTQQKEDPREACNTQALCENHFSMKPWPAINLTAKRKPNCIFFVCSSISVLFPDRDMKTCKEHQELNVHLDKTPIGNNKISRVSPTLVNSPICGNSTMKIS
jgi:hypothetical protein